MKLKQIAVFFALLAYFNFTYAQKRLRFPSELNYKESEKGGGIAHYDSQANILYSIGVHSVDSNTTFYYPLNQIAPYINFSYFTNSALVQVNFHVHSSIPVDNMLYSIVTDKDSITQWKKLDGRFVKQNEPNGDYYTNIFLEPVACRNKILTVKLYNISNPEVVLKQIVSTVPIEKPMLFGDLNEYRIIDSVEVNGIRVAKQRQKQINLESARLTTLDMQEIEAAELFLNTDNSPYVYSVFLVRARKGQTDTIPIHYVWGDFETNIMEFFLSKFKRKASYKNIYMASIPVELIRGAGSYELLVVPAFMKSSNSKSLYAGKKASIKFEVHQSRVINEVYVVLYSLLFLLIASSFFIWYKRKQRRKLKQQQQLTREAKLKLEAVRSQLNPHFVFNALAGIQNLMNKNEIAKALNYLSSFSRITRSVLDNSTKELITVDEEIKWLTDYLEMEQLRFGFQYKISVDKNLDKHNLEIPAMLVQPFIENAIKHGISSLKENGHIDISFHKLNNDMQVTISDNGKGFDVSKEYSGAGLPLSGSRVDLLNTIYKSTPAHLTIDSTNNGTKVIVTLKNWL